MSTPIEGKVAAVIDDTTLVLNVGREQGVQEGMAFAIFALHGEIEDPDSGESLGPLGSGQGAGCSPPTCRHACVQCARPSSARCRW